MDREMDEDQVLESESGQDEPGKAADTSEEPKKEESKMVPLEALQEERYRRQELQRQLQSENIERARLNDRIETLARLMQSEQQEKQAVKYEDDPAEYLRAKAQEVDGKVAQIDQWRRGQEYAANIAGRQAQFIQAAQSQVSDFMSKTVDYPDAYRYINAIRNAELNELGYSDPAMRAHIIAQEETALAAKALMDGANPAERLYNYAKKRGYNTPSSRDSAEKLENIARGQEAARSLSNVPSIKQTKTRLQELESMSDEEFDKATQGDKWKKLFT